MRSAVLISNFPIQEVFWDPSVLHAMNTTEPAQTMLLGQDVYAGYFGSVEDFVVGDVVGLLNI